MSQPNPAANQGPTININEPSEVRYWTERFGVSEDELRRAVEQVGNSVDEVEKRLRPN